jgi:hypothetical protein
MTRTVVLQSRRAASSPWLSRCAESVAAWARGRGYEHAIAGDDAFFGHVPAALRSGLRGVSLPTLADAARLFWATAVLARPAVERAVWVDDDVLMLGDGPDLPPDADVVLTREQWLSRHSSGELVCTDAVNNCMMAFRRGSRFLAFYLWSVERMAARGGLHKTSLGPDFLTSIARHVPIDVVASVPTLSPLVLRDLANDDDELLGSICQGGLRRLRGAHLCGSLVGRTLYGVEVTDGLIERAIEALLHVHARHR